MCWTGRPPVAAPSHMFNYSVETRSVNERAVVARLSLPLVATLALLRTVMGMRVRLLIIMLAVFVVLVPNAPTNAHGSEPHDHIIGREGVLVDGSVLSATPRVLRVAVPDQVMSAYMLLKSADGRELPLTGEVRVFNGHAEGSPPYLEAGTYLVEVRYHSGPGSSVKTVAFSVGAESAKFTGTGTWSSVPLLQVFGAGAALLAGAVAAWVGSASRRRRLVLAAISSAAAFIAVGASFQGVGLSAVVAALALAAAAAAAATGCSYAPYLVVGSSCVAAPLLLTANLQPSRAAAVAVLAAAGVAAIAVTVGALASLSRGGGMVTTPPEPPGERLDSDRRRDLSEIFASTGSRWLTLATAGVAASAWWVALLIGLGTTNSAGVFLTVVSGVLVLSLILPLVAVSVARLAARKMFAATLRPAAVLVAAAALLPLAGFLVEQRPQVILATSTPADPSSCLAGMNRLATQRCLDEAYTAVARRDGVNASLEQLGKLFQTAPQARFYCHETSHAIGRESLRLNGDLAAAFVDGFDVCDFGYYHGIVEAAAGHLDDSEFRAAVPHLCGELASADRLFMLQCTHGLGHAAARRTNNDMIKALSFCDELDNSSSLQPGELDGALNGCGTGVTMEWFAVATAVGLRAVSPEVSEVRDVCNVVPQRWVSECFEYVGNTLDTTQPVASLRELAGWCSTTAAPAPCFVGLARAAGGVGVNPQDAIAICDLGGPARDGCIRFYIAGVATTVEYRVEVVDEVCALLPPTDRTGPTSLCAELRPVVESILSAGDGKPRFIP